MIVLTQTCLIDKVLKYTGMDKASTQPTPEACDPLGSYNFRAPFEEAWSYRSAVGMLLYVCSNTDMQFSVHQVCRFAHTPKTSHGLAIKWILRYPVATRQKGLEFIPNLEESLDC